MGADPPAREAIAYPETIALAQLFTRRTLPFPGPVAQRVQSASWPAQQIREPTWIPRETDRQAEASTQEWAAAGSVGTFIGMAPERAGTASVEFDPVTAAISQALYPEAPDASPVCVQPDSEGILWVTQDGSARRPGIWADLQAKRQFLAARHTGTAQDQRAGTAADQTHPESASGDSHARAIRDNMAHLTEQARARRNESVQALATPLHRSPCDRFRAAQRARAPPVLDRTREKIAELGWNADPELWSAPSDEMLVSVAAKCQHAPECTIRPMPTPQPPVA
ncbi:hypothetical protein [Streptomyces sp. NPDC046759]|uniref:hypothetical protein n=1 Tax=Streptomyces sp. NPDC046759 TaxID=3155019 RepID=UPI0033D45ED9